MEKLDRKDLATKTHEAALRADTKTGFGLCVFVADLFFQ